MQVYSTSDENYKVYWPFNLNVTVISSLPLLRENHRCLPSYEQSKLPTILFE